jgi:atypical dual specificity phosphatase
VYNDLGIFISIIYKHSLAGVSRSVTIAIAYIMTATELSYQETLNAVRGARKIANPNFGFQRQLQNYEFTAVKTVNIN